jgi:peptidoglycan hydrolase-like protein with peptidoglycan-binding domain
MALTSRRFARNGKLQDAARNSPPLRNGSTGQAVEILQRALIDLGFPMPLSTARDPNVPDGIFGQETARKVREFQSQQRLTVDGIAGQETLTRMDQMFAAAEALEFAQLPLEAQVSFWS